ncbi:hypothetical protein [Cognatishimia sp. F0-27]|uniref:hypothetical protein n=1 Tax=Cognatishimia sp. F0-27 TaxID=2816855 RepID=UPI001D0C777A|nr:hypothetical protein [Cognatishimia sp. F0-27]MCC1494507.1 hypothetical protein [Cognatishimia sp. F0-27]
MQAEMFGVVLWADTEDRKAIVWCEDQGNLAYYSAEEHSTSFHDGLSLDAGDLIQFEMRETREFRHVSNPRRVGQSVAPGLADRLRTVADPRRRPEKEPLPVANTRRDNVVLFPDTACA